MSRYCGNRDVRVIFAKVLIIGTSRLLKMGFDRGYVEQNIIDAGIRGKIDFGSSLKKNLFKNAKTQCQFDELSYNILNNQILKATIQKLSKVDELEKELKEKLNDLCRRLHEIEDIVLSKAVFRRIQLNRNNSFYDFLLKICELIFDNLLPTEQKGHSKFRDFIRDESQMASFFEEFVRNFYKLEQDHYKVYREDILWPITASDETSVSFMPKMQTDISLESSDTKIIIDAKYYREALNENYEKEKIKSANLYQMFAYLKNLEAAGEINKNCTGILLYPTVAKDLDINVTTHGHQISFKTINLNQEWSRIHTDLLAIVGAGCGQVIGRAGRPCGLETTLVLARNR
ncbi:MAG: restriction endonuclease [Candidatus Pacebacteria bacterium]|nr:restriction endonuclease [Candidatus Paceibacterota bacterium]